MWGNLFRRVRIFILLVELNCSWLTLELELRGLHCIKFRFVVYKYNQILALQTTNVIKLVMNSSF